MNEPPKKRWGCLQWGIVIGVFLLGWMFVASLLPMVSRQGVQTKGVNNCKEVILALKYFAKDWGSAYPDVRFQELRSSNQIFRKLFQEEEVLGDEHIFGCPDSSFVPDGLVGSAPNYEKAITPGECHWMLLKEQTDAAPSRIPLIIENSLNTSWPTQWDVMPSKGRRKRGQAWPGREIIIGRNDGSVAVEKLRPDGTLDWHSPTNLDEHGKSWIDYLMPEQVAKLSYWDIEEK